MAHVLDTSYVKLALTFSYARTPMSYEDRMLRTVDGLLPDSNCTSGRPLPSAIKEEGRADSRPA